MIIVDEPAGGEGHPVNEGQTAETFQVLGFRRKSSGIRVQGFGFRVQVSGFEVKGLGFRV